MKLLKILLCAAVLSGASVCASAQTKAETKLYTRTVEKPSLKAFDKFLKKYPSSVYAEDISARRDTLLSITPYSVAEAEAIISEYLPAGSVFKAFPDRKDAVDRIYGVCISSPELDYSHIKLYTAVLTDGAWSLADSYESPTSSCGEGSSRRFADSTAVYEIRGDRYFRFNFLTESAGSDEMCYTAATWSPANDSYSEVLFEGRNILASGDSMPFRIEGRINESAVLNPELPAESGRPDLGDPAELQHPAGEQFTGGALRGRRRQEELCALRRRAVRPARILGDSGEAEG